MACWIATVSSAPPSPLAPYCFTSNSAGTAVVRWTTAGLSADSLPSPPTERTVKRYSVSGLRPSAVKLWMAMR
ncbi:hypothetical protein D3C80_1701580 [compost metagenome]